MKCVSCAHPLRQLASVLAVRSWICDACKSVGGRRRDARRHGPARAPRGDPRGHAGRARRPPGMSSLRARHADRIGPRRLVHGGSRCVPRVPHRLVRQGRAHQDPDDPDRRGTACDLEPHSERAEHVAPRAAPRGCASRRRGYDRDDPRTVPPDSDAGARPRPGAARLHDLGHRSGDVRDLDRGVSLGSRRRGEAVRPHPGRALVHALLRAPHALLRSRRRVPPPGEHGVLRRLRFPRGGADRSAPRRLRALPRDDRRGAGARGRRARSRRSR